ncbi:hypothetical protein LCGC14_1170040 [marine sediment metagenome]|uniref:Uncharacterized protein n=1 Tax=marine sediment metagenome TaxID=412755 RepID=A0A0F9MD19_9ZZZZ
MDLDAAFGWPKGTVRGILALSVIGGMIVGMFINPDAAQELKLLAGVVIGFYFGSKAKEGSNV